jgi:nitrogen fixation NifU-like protein
MTEAVKGKAAADAEAMFQAFRDMLAGGANAPGKLAAFSGVRAFPSRIKCANLAWHALHAALQNSADPVTTESARDF